MVFASAAGKSRGRVQLAYDADVDEKPNAYDEIPDDAADGDEIPNAHDD
jgi:hypothetical protein